MPRISWKQYFLNIAKEVATRSTCIRRQVGAVLVRKNQIISTGYNGAPRGIKHCKHREGGCLRKNVSSGANLDKCLAVHAEQNAIIQAARLGISTIGSTLYCTHAPCSMCAKMIINAGIITVVANEPYADKFGLELLREAYVSILGPGGFKSLPTLST